MRMCLAAGAMILLAQAASAQAEPEPSAWQKVLDTARGQTVHWHAWGGDPRINGFIAWLGDELEARHGVSLVHVKLADTADAVTRVITEASAGRDTDGAVDAIWINGPNFASMKARGLLHGPFAEELPNWRYVDTQANPAVLTDFTIPVEGYGAPWAAFRMVFEYDAAMGDPPATIPALAEWIAANPGRFTYPQPPDYAGTTFLKQVLISLTDTPEALQRPAEEADHAQVTAPLWDYIETITPDLWRGGRVYPSNETALGQLLADDEIDIGFSFNPGRVSAAIADLELPESARTFVPQEGTLGNASFFAIPYNATNREGGLVLANLILDPLVQAHAQDPAVLGFQTVLGMHLLGDADRARFDALDLGPATLPPQGMGQMLPEPHPSWDTRLAADWVARYGVAE